MKSVKIYVFLLTVVFVIVSGSQVFAQEKIIKLNEETMRRLKQIEKQEQQRKKIESQMHMTRTDLAPSVKPSNNTQRNEGCQFNPTQMRRFADTVDASRGKAGILFIPSLIQQSRQLDRQCEESKSSTRKGYVPKSIGPWKK